MGEKIYNFFWWLAGANQKILKEHVVDHDKYFHIGVAIFITALMAVFTGGVTSHYIINQGFDGELSFSTIIIAILWGLVILSLDRFLVLSIKKQGNSLLTISTYEKFQNFMREFIFVIPRILLAILIATIILTPLELFIFKDQISNYIPMINEEEKSEFIRKKRKEEAKIKKRFKKDTKEIKNKYLFLLEPQRRKKQNLKIELDSFKKNFDTLELKNLKKQKDKKIKDIAALLIIRDDELRTGNGQGYQNAKNNHLKESNNLTKLIDKIKIRQEQSDELSSKEILKINKLLKEVKEKIEEIKLNKIEDFRSLDKKYKDSLHKIEQERQKYINNYQGENIIIALKAKDILFEKDDKYKQIDTLLTALLMTIELLPLIIKLLLSRSSYDAHMERISYEESRKHDSFQRDEKIKYQMLFKSLRLQEDLKYETLNKILNSI